MNHLRIVVCLVTAFQAHNNHFHYHVHVQLQLPQQPHDDIPCNSTVLPTPSTPPLAIYSSAAEMWKVLQRQHGWSHIHRIHLAAIYVSLRLKVKIFPLALRLSHCSVMSLRSIAMPLISCCCCHIDKPICLV